MKELKILFIISVMFALHKTTFAQLEIKAFTDKDSYEYGEPIKLYCKIINNTDTSFSFLAGSSGSCQAEFIFNDFYSYKHTFCLPASEMLEFNPYSSRIYTWNIDPKETALPNNDSTQTIICTYYFDLKDTIQITAPKYLGGTISVSYHNSNKTEVEKIRDSLNAKVINSHYVGQDIAEDWQIEGILLDSLINKYSSNPLFKYFVHEVMISYESIKNENYIDYYPLQVGNKWVYEVKRVDYGTDYYPSKTNYNLVREIDKDTTMNNGKSYSKIIEKIGSQDSTNICFERIDSMNFIVYRYDETFLPTKEYIFTKLKVNKNDTLKSYDKIEDQIVEFDYSLTSTAEKNIFSSDSIKIFTNSYGATSSFNYELSNKLGLTSYFKTRLDGFDESWKIVAAEINDKKFGDSVYTGIQKVKNIPNRFSLSQNYPNPFNPTTTIKYTIPVSQDLILTNKITLKVFDVLGREIATLVNQVQKPGNHKITFNAKNLSSGIYFYQLKSDNLIEIRKMVILK